MAKERFKLPVAVFLYIVKDGNVLLLRRANSGWHDGEYDLVAGHADGGEPLTAVGCREALEEVGIMIDPSELCFTHLLHGFFTEDGKEYFDIYFEVSKWQGEPSIREPEKCSDLQWFPLDRLPENLTPSTRLGLAAYTSKLPYAEFGFQQ